MKKTLLVSAITLTFLGFATNSAFAEEKHLQTTTAETTQETTTTEKERKSTPSTKETAPSTETSSSLPKLLQVQVQVQTRKRRQKLLKSKKWVDI